MSRCDGCGGEDCVCCEVYMEEQADQRYSMMYGDDDGYDPFAPRMFDDEEEDEECDM